MEHLITKERVQIHQLEEAILIQQAQARELLMGKLRPTDKPQEVELQTELRNQRGIAVVLHPE